MRRKSLPGLVLASCLAFALTFASCANPAGADPAASSDPGDTSGGATDSGITISRTGAVGWNGTSSVSVTASTVDGSDVWTVTNNNYNSAPVFTLALGSHTLGEYAGISCTVTAVNAMTWKNVYLELMATGSSAMGVIGNNANYLVSSRSTGSSFTAGESLSLQFDFAGLDAAHRALTGNVQFALGISAESGTSYTISDLSLVSPPSGQVLWTSADSLKAAWEPVFGYFGLAVEYSELSRSDVQTGLARHATGITMGNEFKPDYILGSSAPATTATFTARDGITYTVPAELDWDVADDILSLCKAQGLQMRGHVLVWHSQSPDWFFRTGLSDSGDYVDTATMNARLEWYIKSVMAHVADWESTNNAGGHIITTWDVVNEVTSDSANASSLATTWLRGMNGESSDWYGVYGSSDFIVNAFRYANHYAPSDVKLAYNDYNTYISGKTAAIKKLIDTVQAASDTAANWGTRLDTIGMQSHVGLSYPGVSAHETAVNAFLAKNVDVEITELDIHCPDNSASGQAGLATLYGNYMHMFQSHARGSNAHGITGVTIWGLTDANTWLSSLNSETSYPLLLDGWFYTKPAFQSVLSAAD